MYLSGGFWRTFYRPTSKNKFTSWHRNTLLVFGRPKLWALEAPPTSLLGALPSQAQGNNLGQTQTRGSGIHPPSSLKSEMHLSSEIQPPPPNPPEDLSEGVWSSTSLRLTAGWQAGVKHVVPWDIYWPTPEPNADKSQLCSTVWPNLCAANPRGNSYKLWVACSFI